MCDCVLFAGVTCVLYFCSCDCGFFAQSQIDAAYWGDQTAAPLYFTSTDLDPNACTFPVGGANPCKSFCNTWATGQVEDEGFNYCTSTPDVYYALFDFCFTQCMLLPFQIEHTGNFKKLL